MFLALHPMKFISLNSFVLLEHLTMLLTSTLAINCSLRNFLNKAISMINFAKPFLNFIDDTMFWYLNSKLDLNDSCTKDFRNLNSMVTWCIDWTRLLALMIFQRSSLKWFPIIKRLAIKLMYCNRLHAWWSIQSRLATLLSSLIACQLVGLQISWRFYWWDGRGLMIWLLVWPTGVYLLDFFALVFSFIYCWVLIFAISPFYILIYMF